MIDRQAEFDHWLHERGYTYSGPNTMYALTIPEIARLYRGWRLTKEAEIQGQQQVDAGAGAMTGAGGHGATSGATAAGLGGTGTGGGLVTAQTNPHRRAKAQAARTGGLRQSDLQAAQEFADDRGLSFDPSDITPHTGRPGGER